MIFQFSIFHVVFVLGLFYIWQKIDRKLDYKHYLKISFLIGLPLGLAVDFLGVLVFKMWYYDVRNFSQYLLTNLATYVVITPIVIETTDYFINFSNKFKGKFKINDSLFSLKYYLIEFLFTIISIIYLYLAKTFWNLQTSDVGVILFCGLLIFTICDSVLGLLKIEGILTKILKGNYFHVGALVVAGLVTGFLWETFNYYIRIWFWVESEWPSFQFLNIPVAIIFMWCGLNLCYWSLLEIYKKFGIVG